MRMLARSLILSASLAAIAATPSLAQAPAPATATQAQQSAHDRLFKLFKDSDEASLKRNPLNALSRGDLRYADRLGDNITDKYYAGERAAAEHDLAALHAIPRDQLDATDQLAYDVFEFQTKDTLKGLQPDMLAWADGAAACVVLAAAGYPGTPRRGDIIHGVEAADEPGALIFHASTDWDNGTLVTAGGRVLCVTGLGHTRAAALARAYEIVDTIQFDGMQRRSDIGRA